MNLNDILSCRRSIRQYSSQAVKDSDIKKWMELAARTSTCGNMQLYSVIITRDENIKKELCNAHFNQPAATTANVLLTFCADYNRFGKWCEQNRAVPGFDNEESLINGIIDTVALAQTFSLLAEQEGLGICYLGTTTYNPEMIGKTLKLPKMVVPVVTLSLGYPAESPIQADRIDVDAWLHNETYHDYSKEDIDKAYGYKDKMEHYKSFVKEKGKETLAQVFTDISYPKKSSDLFSAKLMQYIKNQGFTK